jgi:DNA-binding NtrC family response regulator
LIEAELFGHEKGAFTGAVGAKIGLFESANGGTLLLDEIGDMPLSLQAKLLRVLQESEVRRVGSNSSRKIDVRVLAATHQDLKTKVAQGSFRQDLLYRLEVIGVSVPALRERLDDLQELALHFFRLSKDRHLKNLTGISQTAIEALLRHSWPGNVRELTNVIERAVVMAQGEQIEVGDLPIHLQASETETIQVGGSSISVAVGTSLRDVEDLLIRKTLEATSGDKNMTARILGINSRTIYRKLDKDKRTPS